MTIDALPEDVIMRIFDFHVNDVPIYDRNDQHRMAKWRTLVHVCQRWRCLTFGSPRRLGLALEYTGKKPMEETMAVWPALPIAVIPPELVGTRATNIAEALDSNRERVSEIRLVDVPRSHWDRFVAVMESPFPRLTHLQFCDNRNSLSLSPVSPHFLGGSGPNLQRLELKNIAYPFSTIQKLLLTANNLVSLTLWHTPHAGYVSPESMVTCLSGMPRLDNLCLRFRPFGPYPSRPSPPPTRIIIPALTKISFKGPYEYLEDLVARIDIPRLRSLNINFFMDLMFDIPQLHHFISHTQQLRNLDHAELLFSDRSVSLQLIRRIPPSLSVVELALTISCRQSDWQLSSLARVCLSRLPPFSTLEHLMIVPDQSAPPQWKDDMESIQWLELLDPFPALKTLYLPEDVALRVGNACRTSLRKDQWKRCLH
ncbi:hypothetical protein F5148DRAFT_589961 [Russula earlei]|uniref:Uncharacterized protein n=1 Tax=Russula earlei TaxID=71964 RepID=A0ACC0TVW3_9AGAM|nr:hypothetical protein F5148DRAFT_589961 [Russula earlei]